MIPWFFRCKHSLRPPAPPSVSFSTSLSPFTHAPLDPLSLSVPSHFISCQSSCHVLFWFQRCGLVERPCQSQSSAQTEVAVICTGQRVQVPLKHFIIHFIEHRRSILLGNVFLDNTMPPKIDSVKNKEDNKMSSPDAAAQAQAQTPEDPCVERSREGQIEQWEDLFPPRPPPSQLYR